MIALLIAATTFVEFGFTWEIREGQLGAGSPWSSSGITRFSRASGPPGSTNRRVGISCEEASAGITLRSKPAFGKFTVYIEGALYTLDPAVVAAVWLYDDRPGKLGGVEADWEFGSWGDTHTFIRHTLGIWNKGIRNPSTVKIPTTTAIYHKVVIEQQAAYSAVKVWDWRDSDSRWIELAYKRWDVIAEPGATLRIALWRNGDHINNPAKRGQSRIYVCGVTWEP